jgi:hypothetical protein
MHSVHLHFQCSKVYHLHDRKNQDNSFNFRFQIGNDRQVRTIFTLKIIVSIFVKLFLILVLHLRQFFIVRIFVKRATELYIIWLYIRYGSDKGSSWSWSYGSWIYDSICNQCISPLKLWVRTPVRRGVPNTTLCDKVCQWLAAGRSFSPGSPVSPSIKLTTMI